MRFTPRILCGSTQPQETATWEPYTDRNQNVNLPRPSARQLQPSADTNIQGGPKSKQLPNDPKNRIKSY